MATADVAYPNALLDFARARGLNVRALCTAAALDERTLQEQHARVPSDRVYALFDALAAATGDPTLGLSLAASTEPDSGALAIVRYAASNATTIREVAQRAAALLTIVDDTNACVFEEDEDTARYGLVSPRPPEPINPYAVQYSLAQQFRIGRLIAARPFAPTAVHFVQARPAGSLEAFERAFHCTAFAFGQSRDEMLLDPADLDRGVVGADPALGRLLLTMAHERLAQLSRDDGIEAQVRRAIVATLPEGAGLPMLAHRLSMSARTLQRRLKEAGHSHRALVEDTRRGLAERMVAEARMTQTDIAYLLGYSDSTAFARAFRRWFGTSPAAFQRDA